MAPVKKPKPILGSHHLRAWRDFRDAAIAIGEVVRCLKAIQAGKPISAENLSRLAGIGESLNRQFDTLTGYQKDGE